MCVCPVVVLVLLFGFVFVGCVCVCLCVCFVVVHAATLCVCVCWHALCLLGVCVCVWTECREARLLSSISHPNVIRFFDEFVDDEMLHIVMEFAPYGTLKQNLAKMTGLIPESSAVWIMLNIINGLDFLHQRKIVHRDLSRTTSSSPTLGTCWWPSA